jgi:two-component system alkaline phosphatase synthesis response regulator PhoP
MKKRILLVDDSPMVLKMTKAQLEKEGYEVLSAKDGLEGLELARKEIPDLILLDLMLPKLDGYKVCRMLKFDKALENIPVIVVSARESQPDRKLAEESGCDAYLTKPWDPLELLQTIHKLKGS